MSGPWENYKAESATDTGGGPWENFQGEASSGPWEDFQEKAPSGPPIVESTIPTPLETAAEVGDDLFIRPFRQLGRHAAKGLNEGLGHMAKRLADAVDGAYDSWGKDLGLTKGDAFRRAQEFYDENSAYWDERIASEGDNVISEVVGQALGGAAPGVAEFMTGVAAEGALETMASGPVAGAEAAAKRALMGGMMKGVHGVTPAASVPINAAMFAGQTAAEGGNLEDIAKAAGTGASFGFIHRGDTPLKSKALDFVRQTGADARAVKTKFDEAVDLNGLRVNMPKVDPVGEFPLRRKIIGQGEKAEGAKDGGITKMIQDVINEINSESNPKTEKKLEVVDDGNPITVDTVINQISKLGRSVESQKRKVILEHIGDGLAEGKSVETIRQELNQIANERGLGKDFDDLVSGIFGTLKDDANPGDISKRVGVGAAASKTPGAAEAAKNADMTPPEFQGESFVRLPELIDLTKALTDGKLPELKEIILNNPNYLGVFFTGQDKFMRIEPGDMWAKKELMNEPGQLERTLAHEIGHAADWSLDKAESLSPEIGNMVGRIKGVREFIGELDLNENIMSELKNLSQTWKPFNDKSTNPKDVDYTNYRYSAPELYADAVSVLLNRPELVQRIAPEFDKLFHETLDARPNLKAEYTGIMEAAVDPAKLGERRTGKVREMWEGAEEQWRRKEAKATELDVLGQIKRDLVDVQSAAIRAVKIEEKARGEKISPEANPIFAFEEVRYVHGEVRENLLQIEEKVLPLLKEAKLSTDDLSELMLHEHIVNNRQNIQSTGGFNPTESAAQLKVMREGLGEKKYGKLHEASRAYRKIREETIIPLLEKSGMFTKKQMDIIKGREFYARMDVVKHIYDEISGGGASGGTIGNLMKTQLGSWEDTAPAFTSTVLQDIKFVRSVRMNEATKSMVKFLQNATATDKLLVAKRAPTAQVNGKWMPKPPAENSDYGLISFVEKGKVQGFYVDRHIAKAYKAEPSHSNAAWNALRISNVVWKEAFTNRNPGFWLFNGSKDYIRGAKNIKGNSLLKFLPHYIKAIKPAFRDAFGIPDDVVRKMYTDSMLISVESQWGLTTEEKAFERQLARSGLSKGNSNMIKAAWDAWGNIGQAIERMPKIAGKSYIEQHHPDMPLKQMAHNIRAQVGSPDFMRRGRVHNATNNIFLFSNAIKEGWRGDWEVAKERPGEYAFKTAKYNLMPKVLMFAAATGALNQFMPDAEEIMKGVSEFDKTNYFIVPLYLDENGDSVFLRVPMDETGRFFGGLLWKGMNTATNEDDKREMMDHIGDLTSYMAGQAPTFTPTFGVPTDMYNYAVGNNVYDGYRHQNAIEERDYEAGPWDPRNLRDFGRYEWNKMGGRVIRQAPYDNLKRPKTKLTEIYDIPVLGPVLQRFVKTSHAGRREHLKNVSDPGRRADARHDRDLKEWVIDDINEVNLHGADAPKIFKAAAALYKKLNKEGKIDKKLDSPEAVIAKYIRYANKSNADAYYDTLMGSRSKREKALMFKEIEEELGPDRYKEFVKKGLKIRAISKADLKTNLYLKRKELR